MNERGKDTYDMPECGNDPRMKKEPRLRIPHPERLLFPEAGVTRGDVASYYAEVAPYLLHQAQDRALMVTRWPHGIEGAMFYQKHPAVGGPITITTAADILSWVGQGVIEWHAPLGKLSSPEQHDWAVMDLDPQPPANWTTVVEVATVFKKLLDLMKVSFLIKTSGQRGLHFYIAIEPLSHHVVREIVGHWAGVIVKTIPEKATVARRKQERGARVYLDYLQNGYQRTMAMAYSVRATSRATVSMPIAWHEVDIPAETWTIQRVRAHLQKRGNLFSWQGPPVALEALARQYGWRKKGGTNHEH